MKKLLILLMAFAPCAMADNVVITDHQLQAAKPLPVYTVSKIGGASATTRFYSGLITTNATTNVTATTAYITSVVVSTTNIGTTEVLKIQDKSGTPKVIYQVGSPLVLGTVTPINGTAPLIMTGGIDIVTSGTTAGSVSVWITYQQ